jgi:hypothetical protein
MRIIRSVALAATLTLSTIATAEAQGPRPFRDSWFWGVHGGLTSYTAADPIDARLTGVSALAPEVGVDWLITRKTGGLYMSFSQAFLTSQGAVLNGPTSADTGFRYVDVKNLRRVNVAATVFPGDWVRLRTYVGFGIAFDYLGAAQPVLLQTDTDRQEEFAQAIVAESKAALGPLFIGGVQYRVLSAVSAYGQFTAAAMSKDFLLSNGNPVSLGFQFGLRYNIGSSIDRGY